MLLHDFCITTELDFNSKIHNPHKKYVKPLVI